MISCWTASSASPAHFRRLLHSSFCLQPCPRLVVIELKKPGVPARAAFDENLTHRAERIVTSPLIPLPIRCGEGHAVLVQRAVGMTNDE
jgi:hypothetical protein